MIEGKVDWSVDDTGKVQWRIKLPNSNSHSITFQEAVLFEIANTLEELRVEAELTRHDLRNIGDALWRSRG